jgi:hypothetical protein
MQKNTMLQKSSQQRMRISRARPAAVQNPGSSRSAGSSSSSSVIRTGKAHHPAYPAGNTSGRNSSSSSSSSVSAQNRRKVSLGSSSSGNSSVGTRPTMHAARHPALHQRALCGRASPTPAAAAAMRVQVWAQPLWP